MKKIFAGFLLISFTMSEAQVGMRTPTTQIGESSRWTFGGYAGVGGAFGHNGATTIYLTPRVGYKLAEAVELGVAGNFSWNNSRYYSSTMLGVGPFLNFYLGRSFYLSGLFQEYFVNQRYKSSDTKSYVEEAALYLGGGYMQRLGNHAYLQLGGMYNVLYKENQSVFSGGFVPQIGVVFGL